MRRFINGLNIAACIRGDHPIANGGQRHLGPLFFLAQSLLRQLAVGDVNQRTNRACGGAIGMRKGCRKVHHFPQLVVGIFDQHFIV